MKREESEQGRWALRIFVESCASTSWPTDGEHGHQMRRSVGDNFHVTVTFAGMRAALSRGARVFCVQH